MKKSVWGACKQRVCWDRPPCLSEEGQPQGAGRPRGGVVPTFPRVVSRLADLSLQGVVENSPRRAKITVIPAFAGMTNETAPLFVVTAPERVKATPLKGKSDKGNPPYPPLSGGREKAKPPLPGGGASPFYTPLTRGGRGGCFSSREGRPLYSLKRRVLHRAFPSGCPAPQGKSDSLLSRLLAMLFKSEVRSCAGGDQFRARRGFSTTPEAAG